MSTNPNMEAIETITVGATSVANITFSNIPQGYTDLKVVVSPRVTSSSTPALWMDINGTTSGYSGRFISATGASAGSGTRSYAHIDCGVVNYSTTTSNTFGSHDIYIPNYTSSNNKSISIDAVQESNATTAYTYLLAGLWSNSAAITNLVFTIEDGSNFVQYSSATLYGVTSAATAAKATGGIIAMDDNYFYHTFLASGTFTPSQALYADYLVVAGGGGGGQGISGNGEGGGGGAGGLRSTVTATGGGGSLESALSLTAQAYTVTVGGGGAAGANGSNSVFDTITSTGGGRGGTQATAPGVGGSGGGGYGRDATNNTGAVGTANQGFAGQSGVSFTSGGGGGAGEIGGTNATRAGGDGVAVSITGSSVTYAGGGGGTTGGNTGGAGGDGGGGAGDAGSGPGAGTANTGGAGGGGRSTASANGGAGGSGIVIVRYAK